jgi:DNA invertase Pin-like site-specific DNA recombinase
MRVALYSRVSTHDQNPENQILEMRRYVAARGWTITGEFTDRGVSGAKAARPALDAMLRDAKRRKIDGVVVWRLDRLARNLKHLVMLIDELKALSVAFVSLNEAIDTSTPAGTLQLHLLGAIAEFERGRIRERVVSGIARARASGKKWGRPRPPITDQQLSETAGLSLRTAAAKLGVSKSFVQNWRASQRRGAPRSGVFAESSRPSVFVQPGNGT